MTVDECIKRCKINADRCSLQKALQLDLPPPKKVVYRRYIRPSLQRGRGI